MNNRPNDYAQRADLARLLAACYYEPSLALAEEGVFDSMTNAAGDGELVAATARLGAAFSAVDLQELLVDYTRLFLGPTRPLAAPYGSIWLSGEHALMQESTVAVRRLFHEQYFELDDEFRELPDHIAAELELLYVLLFRQAEAQHRGDSAAVNQIDTVRCSFLAEHLGRWVPAFADATRSNAQTAFYAVLADLTAMLVSREAALCAPSAD